MWGCFGRPARWSLLRWRGAKGGSQGESSGAKGDWGGVLPGNQDENAQLKGGPWVSNARSRPTDLGIVLWLRVRDPTVKTEGLHWCRTPGSAINTGSAGTTAKIHPDSSRGQLSPPVVSAYGGRRVSESGHRRLNTHVQSAWRDSGNHSNRPG